MTYCVIMHNMIVENEGEGVDRGLEFEHTDSIQLLEKNPTTFQYLSKCINGFDIE